MSNVNQRRLLYTFFILIKYNFPAGFERESLGVECDVASNILRRATFAPAKSNPLILGKDFLNLLSSEYLTKDHQVPKHQVNDQRLKAGCISFIHWWYFSHLLFLSYQVKEEEMKDEVEWWLMEVEEPVEQIRRSMKEIRMDEVKSWWTG